MIEVLKSICRDCGNLLLSLPLNVSEEGKWDGSQFKAKADRIANEFISTELRKAFSLPILSEESDDKIPEYTKNYFIIDPIDGTASFCHGFKGWVTQIAYIEEGNPIIGVVYAPALDKMFYAEKGKGAFCNGVKLDCSPNNTKKSPNSILDNYPEPRGITKELVDDFKIDHYVESGSIGLKICKVADNSADLFFKNMTPKDWDLAAPHIILTESGGVLLNQRGEPIIYGREQLHHDGLIATASREIATKVSTWVTSKSRGTI